MLISHVQSEGKFYLDHYQAALDGIRTLEAELSRIQDEFPLMPEDFKRYIQEEKEYLEALREPCSTVPRKIKYVQALNNLARYQ